MSNGSIMSTTCPNDELLARFGQASDDEIQHNELLRRIEIHIVDCEYCLNRLQRESDAGECVSASQKPPDLVGIPSLDGFEIREILGRGGMGTVYRAYQPEHDREVAIKILLQAPSIGSSWLMDEVQAAAESKHRDVVKIYEIGTTGLYPYLVMEYIKGGTLEERVGSRPLHPTNAARLIHRLALAVDHMHQKGFLHRDIKPSNLLVDAEYDTSVDSWHIKIADFGMARRIDARPRTLTLAALGTPGYMAPEQATGKRRLICEATDVYGLGAVLYRLLTARPPFYAASLQEVFALARRGDPIPPRRLMPKLPRKLDTIVTKCLNANPGYRYASAQLLADDLQRFLQGESIVARRPGPAQRIYRFSQRNPIAASLFVALAITAVGTLFFWRKAEVQRERAVQGETLAFERLQDVEANRQRLEDTLGSWKNLVALINRDEGNTVPRVAARFERLQQTLPELRVMVQAEPSDAMLLTEFSRCARELGIRHAHFGDLEASLVVLQEAAEAVETLMQVSEQPEEARHMAVLVYTSLAATCVFVASPEETETALDQAANLLELPGADVEVATMNHRWALRGAELSQWYIAAGLHRKGKRLAAACLDVLSRWNSKHPGNNITLSRIAICHELLGNQEARLAVLKTALEVKPNDSLCQYLLAQALFSSRAEIKDQESRRKRSIEVISYLESCLPLMEGAMRDQSYEAWSKIDFHWAKTMLALSYHDLDRTDDANKVFMQLIKNIQDSIPNTKNLNNLKRPDILAPVVATSPAIEIFPDSLKQAVMTLEDARVDRECLAVASILGQLAGKCRHAGHLEGAAGFAEVASSLVLSSASLWSTSLTDSHNFCRVLELSKTLLNLSQYCRYAGRVRESEMINIQVGSILDALLDSTRSDDADYQAVRSEYWLQISKNLWPKEDWQALQRSLLKCLDAARIANHLDPENPQFTALVDDRLQRLTGFYIHRREFGEARRVIFEHLDHASDAPHRTRAANALRELATGIDKAEGSTELATRCRTEANFLEN